MLSHELALRTECTNRNLKYVGTRGNVNAPVWVVGEAPGADEDASGIPFCGSSGKELDKMLIEAGFTDVNNELCFTNPYKVKPPNNVLERLPELGVPDAAYISQFLEELTAYQPKIIIAAGATPLSILCPQTISKRDGVSKITQWRGSLLSSPKLGWPHYVIPVLHPAAILREWGERQIAVLCLGKAYEEYEYLRKHGQLQPLTKRELITMPSYQTVMEFLHEANESKEAVSNDIETIGGRWPYTISVATSPYRAISFGLWGYEANDSVKIWRQLDLLLSSHRTIGQNYIGFDCHQMYSIGFSPEVALVDDTMVRHHTIWPEFEHKLQFQTFQYTREPYYKDEGKLWSPKEGLDRLQLYNCKDTVVTYEIFQKQEEEFNDRPYLRDFYNNVAIKRARAFYRMDDRGLLVDKSRLDKLRTHVLTEIDKNCAEAEGLVGRPTISGVCLNPLHKSTCKCNLKQVAGLNGIKQVEVFNLGSPKQIITELEKRHIKIPMKRATKYKASRVSVDEETLRKLVLANVNEKLPLSILNIRELNKMLGTYINTRLLNDVLYCSYVPTAAVTFRSGSRTNSFGFGTNQQNLPIHSDLGREFLNCLIARPGKVFVACDQRSAEDWLVQGIIADVSGRTKGLDELRSGVNRHKKLASFLFAKPESEIDKAGMEYYLGKRTRHAGNYGMRETTMANNLLKDGHPIPEPYCKYLLEKFHEVEPDIRGVFHKWVENTLRLTRTLRNPLGFERIFFSLRNYSDNSDVFREAYAQIPQSTVACNNGMAIVYLDEHGCNITMDGHDSVKLEVDDNEQTVIEAVELMTEAYDRTIRFPNGLELVIPIEVELGYSLGTMKTCLDHSHKDGLTSTYRSLVRTQNPLINGTGGLQLAVSKQP